MSAASTLPDLLDRGAIAALLIEKHSQLLRHQAARRRYSGACARAGYGQNQDGQAMDLCVRLSSCERPDAASRVVRLHARPQGRTPAQTSEPVQRHPAGRRLRRLPSSLQHRTHPGSCVLGARPTQVLRYPDRTSLLDGSRGDRMHRCTLRYRERSPRQASGAASRASSVAGAASDRRVTAWA
jgi:hypothetical protein